MTFSLDFLSVCVNLVSMKKRLYYKNIWAEFDEEKDPFFLDEKDIKEKTTWDWHFEVNAYDVKKVTFEYHAPLLDVIVENRSIIDYVFLVSIADVPQMNKKIDSVLVHFFTSLFNRMIKTSKVIQDYQA